MKKIFLIIIIISLFWAGVVYADSYGLEKTADAAGLKNAVSGSSPADIIGNVVGSALTLVGVLFLLLMIYGGIIWMIARGNEQETDKALKTIKAAVIGLIIVIASYAITTFVFKAISGEPTIEPVVEADAVASCINVLPPPNGCTDSVCEALDNEAECIVDKDETDLIDCCSWQL